MTSTQPRPGANDAPKNILPEPAPISVRDIRSVIPAHCFERSLPSSLFFAFQDICSCTILLYLGTCIQTVPLVTVRAALWVAYWIAQGCVMTGLWVIAHECGHQAFSDYLWVNDSIGCVLHTFLLVPYWSWKYSHAKHHSNTDALERDTVFRPRRAKKIHPLQETTMISRLIGVLMQQVFGWPMYLLVNATGVKKRGWQNHFNPYCGLWRPNERRGVICSDLALGVWLWMLFRIGQQVGLTNIVFFYVVPYLIVNHWLVCITFLQHTDVVVPRYRNESWTWLRGALGTVDRDYGMLNHVHHHIADTHVVHHLFSTIPHYHAVDATRALKESGLLGDYWLEDLHTPWYSALWEQWRDCFYLEDEGQQILHFEKEPFGQKIHF